MSKDKKPEYSAGVWGMHTNQGLGAEPFGGWAEGYGPVEMKLEEVNAQEQQAEVIEILAKQAEVAKTLALIPNVGLWVTIASKGDKEIVSDVTSKVKKEEAEVPSSTVSHVEKLARTPADKKSLLTSCSDLGRKKLTAVESIRSFKDPVDKESLLTSYSNLGMGKPLKKEDIGSFKGFREK